MIERVSIIVSLSLTDLKFILGYSTVQSATHCLHEDRGCIFPETIGTHYKPKEPQYDFLLQ
jgi:hypothetical protein